MSKRPSESNTPAPFKHIKPSSRLDDQDNQNGNQASSQDSGYSESQGKVVQSMDLEEYGEQESKADVSDSEYAGSQGQDVQLMDLDENSYQTASCPEQGSDVMVGSSPSKGNIADILSGIRVDEDSNQDPYAEMIKRTNEKSRYFAENVVCCTVAIGPDAARQQKKEKKKRKKEPGLDDKDVETPQDLILKNACALLNSGGGVLVIKSADPQSLLKNMVDNFWKTIEAKLQGLLKSSLTYNEVFDLKVDSDEILLFINAPQHFCSLKYNLFVPGDAAVCEANYDQTVKLLQMETVQGKRQKCSSVDVALKYLPKVPRTLSCKEELRLIESKQVQFKHFRSETYLDSNNRTQCQGISKQISAFANASGGVILLGITDEREVCGLKINEKNSKENIEERVNAIVEKMSRESNFSLQRKVHWDMEFVPVSSSDSNVVVVIYVAGIGSSGGVFVKCPKSFELRSGDDGRKVPCLLNFEEWKKGMLSGLELRSNSKVMEALTDKFDKVGISDGSKGKRYLLTIKGGVQKIKDAFFAVEDRFPVIPHCFESNLPQEAQNVIKEVRRKCSRAHNQGLIMASHSWLSKLKGRPVEGAICDLLIVSRNLGGLHLLTLCHGDDDDGKVLEYSRKVARTIKTRLVRDGACIQKFYVTPHVVPCTGTKTELAFRPNTWYPSSYDLRGPREKLNDVLKALVIILAAVPSALSSKLGVTFMNLLTKEQFQLVHEQIEINRELFIKGAAGTGKTVVAVEFMRELKRREKLKNEEILYICETVGIANQIREQGVCEVVCRETFEDSQFPNVRHVVMDEAQNYRVSNKDFDTKDPLYHKARDLVRQHGQDPEGYLWIFADKCQADHNFPTGLPDETQQRPRKTLTKVIRNSRQIFNYAKNFLTKVDVKDTLEIGHDFDGPVVESVYYEKLEMDAVIETINSLLSDGYEHKDIAVLFLTTEEHIPSGSYSFQICNAEQNNSSCVVFSSALEYGGLDRPVVILVGYDEWEESTARQGKKKNTKNRFIYIAATRAMVKLFVTRRRYVL